MSDTSSSPSGGDSSPTPSEAASSSSLSLSDALASLGFDNIDWEGPAMRTLLDGLEEIAVLDAKKRNAYKSPWKRKMLRTKNLQDKWAAKWDGLSKEDREAEIDKSFAAVITQFVSGMSELPMPSADDDEHNIMGFELNKVKCWDSLRKSSLAQVAMEGGMEVSGPNRVMKGKKREWDYVEEGLDPRNLPSTDVIQSLVAWASKIDTQEELAAVTSALPSDSGWGQKLSRAWWALDRPGPDTTERRAWIAGDRTRKWTTYRNAKGEMKPIETVSCMRKPAEFDTCGTAPTAQDTAIRSALASKTTSNNGYSQNYPGLFGSGLSGNTSDGPVPSNLPPPLNNGRGFASTLPGTAPTADSSTNAALPTSGWNPPNATQSAASATSPGLFSIGPVPKSSSPYTPYIAPASNSNTSAPASGWGVPAPSGTSTPYNSHSFGPAPPPVTNPYSANANLASSGWNRPPVSPIGTGPQYTTRTSNLAPLFGAWPASSASSSATPLRSALRQTGSNTSAYSQPSQPARSVQFANPQSCASEMGSVPGMGMNASRVGF